MRILFAGLANLILFLIAALRLPFHLLGSRTRPAYVRFRLKGDIPYRVQLSSRRRLFAKKERDSVASLQELERQLKILERDGSVKGVVFRFDSLECPPAKRQALGVMFDGLKAAGKDVVAFAVSASNGEYELMSRASRLVLSPAGRLDVIGFAAEATALAGGLERIGIRAEFVRRGDYKTAPELFTHASLSDIQRRTIEGFLDEQYERLIEAMVSGRGLSRDEAMARIDEGPFSAQRALARGLCDAVCHEADLGQWLGMEKGVQRMPSGASSLDSKAEKTASGRVASFRGYGARRPSPLVKWWRLRSRPRIGVVSVVGSIMSGDGGKLPIGGRVSGSEAVSKALRAAAADSRCRAVVLHVSSPGGSSLASELILEEVQRLNRKKPVVAYFDRVAASGGYMVALGAKEIWSDRSAITGSIGVFAGKFEASALLNRLGIERKVMARGRNAGIFSTARGFTDAERAALEAEVEETYQVFLGYVAQARGRSVEQIHQLAEGRVYSGAKALAVGLVDRLGSFEEACRRALELSGRPVASGFDVASYQKSGGRLSLASVLGLMGQAHLYAWAFPFLPG